MGKHRILKVIVLFILICAGIVVRCQNLELGAWDWCCIILVGIPLSMLLESSILMITAILRDRMKIIDIGNKRIMYVGFIIIVAIIIVSIGIFMCDMFRPDDLLILALNSPTWILLISSRNLWVGDEYLLIQGSLVKIDDIVDIEKREIRRGSVCPKNFTQIIVETSKNKKYAVEMEERYVDSIGVLMDRIKIF